jgi:hypothetical protein
VTPTAKSETGTLRKKIQRQLRASVSTPPTRSPIALPKPAAPMMMPPASPAFSAGSSS